MQSLCSDIINIPFETGNEPDIESVVTLCSDIINIPFETGNEPDIESVVTKWCHYALILSTLVFQYLFIKNLQNYIKLKYISEMFSYCITIKSITDLIIKYVHAYCFFHCIRQCHRSSLGIWVCYFGGKRYTQVCSTDDTERP